MLVDEHHQLYLILRINTKHFDALAVEKNLVSQEFYFVRNVKTPFFGLAVERMLL